MNITLTGANGFLAKTLIERLQKEGHQLHVLGRKPVEGLGFSNWDAMSGPPPEDSLKTADAIVHLAGEPVAQRWTPDVKRKIRDSRILGTRNLVHGLSTQSRRPRVLISGSATGYYGSRGDEVLTEKSAPGDDFLAQVCVDWEKEAQMAESLGVRVVRLRTGVVLGKNGGALQKILPPFRLGLGGRISSGKQWMPWIHIDDIAGLIKFAIKHEQTSGPLNGTAPKPATNTEFTETLAQALRRPAVFTVPAFALKLAYGEMASVVLGSQRAVPAGAQSAGYRFEFQELAVALADVVAR